MPDVKRLGDQFKKSDSFRTTRKAISITHILSKPDNDNKLKSATAHSNESFQKRSIVEIKIL